MPIADFLINAASRHRILSFLDGNAGYNKIFMADEDISKMVSYVRVLLACLSGLS
jgi:hypothetical protein